MSTFGGGGIQSALRRWVSHLLLLAFVARAIVPAGYMPDFAAATGGVFKVVICTASGHQSLTLDAEGNPAPAPSQQHQDQPCAFAAFAALPAPSISEVAINLPTFMQSRPVSGVFAQLPPARAGPAHGSRAPPIYS